MLGKIHPAADTILNQILVKKKADSQSCKSGRAFSIGFGPNSEKNFGLISGQIRRLQINFLES